jgi:hypothetical protein
MKTPIVPIAEIELHPLVANLPRWADDSAEMTDLTRDIAARGIDQPLLVTVCAERGCYLLIDGRHRFAAARLAGLEQVPVLEREEEEAADIVLHSLVNRRHFTKSAQAYLCYPVLAAMAPDKPGRRNQSIESTNSKSIEDLCADLGFSRDLYFQAKQIHEKFSSRPDLRERFEPSILAGAGLGAVIAGMAGQEATLKKGKVTSAPEQLLFQAFSDVRVRFERWDKLPATKREKVASQFCDVVTALPSEVQDAAYETLTALRRHRK